MSAPLVPTADLRSSAKRDDHTGPWFDALAQGMLTVQHCTVCGHRARPDAAACPRCHSAAFRWTAAEGTGTVITTITDHSPAKEGGDPLLLGIVELAEGPWLLARLLDSSVPGDRVSLVVLVPDEGEPVPAFRTQGGAQTPAGV